MASLTGKFIKDTYQSLLKVADNGNVTDSAKDITDGEGNSLGVSVDTSGNVTATGTIQGATVTNGTTSISDLQTGKEDKSEKGAASGYAPLDSDSKVPTANLPDSVLGQLEYKGTWNADTDTPSLPSASTVKGNYYVVSTAGVYETVDYEIGDWIVSNGTAWEKIDNSDKVSSVNGATGVVVLDTDNISEGSTNQYYTSDRANSDFDTRLATKDTGNLAEGSNLYYTEDRVSANTDVAANTAKTGITEAQANAILANTAKNSYPSEDAVKLLGIESGANVTDVANVTTALNSISIKELDDVSDSSPSNQQVLRFNSTSEQYEPTTLDLTGLVDSVNGQSGDVVLDTDDIDEGDTNLYYTEARVSANTDVAANTVKVGITTQQANDITANNAKVSMVLGTGAGTALEGDTELLQLGTTSTTALAGNTTTISAQQASDISTNNAKVGITTGQADAIVANTAKTGITTEQADAIVANTAKVGITTQQASDITANNAKVGITTQQAADIVTNNAKVGITAQQASDITTNNAKISFDSTSSTKLGTIAEGAEVNVNADWNATSGDAEILNKPTIPTNNNQLTNGAGYITDGNTGWDNSYGFITASTTDTLTNKSGNNSQWTNDAGYINEAAQTIHTNAIGNAIDFSARVTLDGGVAEGTSGIIKNLQNIL